MLRHLRATNFAILSDVALELGPGMNVLTGETGAGKSLIVEAVNLLRGGRASADIPRAGADEAVVEAVVEPPDDLRAAIAAVLDAAGLPANADTMSGRRCPASPPNGDTVIVRRVIQRGGRSRCYVNGALTTVARLGELGALLVDLSGQHQHQGLVDAARHLEILDSFGESSTGAMSTAWAALAAAEAELTALASDDRERSTRLDYLKFQLAELAELAPRDGEDALLEAERTRLAAVDRLQAATRAAEERLYGDGGARDHVAGAARELARAVKLDAALEPIARQLGEIEAQIHDAAGELRGYAERLDADPLRLAAIDDRVAQLRALARKHGGTLALAIARGRELADECARLDSHDARLAEARAARDRALAAATEAAAELTKRRVKSAKSLEKQVTAALAELAMGSARLGVVVEPRPLGPTGADRVELVLASNRGEEVRPLARVASGGELSRIMLALKLALRRAHLVATFVFDEVDAGIGGETAHAVAAQIRAVASRESGRQVLCVTHLPQIAAYADQHIHVEKLEVAGRTETRVHPLTGAARKAELARMLGGHATARAKAHAAELLEEARRAAARG